MKQPVFEGLATAIVTPFKNGTIDIPTFEKLLDLQLAANVDAIVVCGTTGESSTLSAQEQLTLIAHAMQYTAGRCKIIAGTGSNEADSFEDYLSGCFTFAKLAGQGGKLERICAHAAAGALSQLRYRLICARSLDDGAAL